MTYNYVEVVVDSLSRALVVTSQDRVLEILDIPDKGRGVVVRRPPTLVDLVELIVEQDVALVLLVDNPALMAVAHTVVVRRGDDSRLGGGRDVVDREAVLVEGVADVAAFVSGVRAVVGEALSAVSDQHTDESLHVAERYSLMHVAVLSSAANILRVGRVAHVDEDKTGSARTI